LLDDTNYNITLDKLNTLQASINIVSDVLLKMQKNRVGFGEWISEREAIEITNLSRSTLLKLRKEGKIRSSTITGKQVYYLLSDFKKLLDKNEEEM